MSIQKEAWEQKTILYLVSLSDSQSSLFYNNVTLLCFMELAWLYTATDNRENYIQTGFKNMFCQSCLTFYYS